MDKSYILQYIDWNNLKTVTGKSADETFELLCADFMRIRYNLAKSPSIGGKTYKGTEGPPEIGPDGMLYGFQSKFSENSFGNKKEGGLYHSCENIWDGTQFLCIFTKDNYPSNKKTSKPYIKGYCPSKNKSSWDAYLCDLKSQHDIKKIEKFCGDSFIQELKRGDYFEICENYFNIDLSEIYVKSEDNTTIDISILEGDIDSVKKGFEGNRAYYESDILRARIIQKQYSYKKLSYSTKPWIGKKFEALEKNIADELFDELSVFGSFSSFKDYLYDAGKLLDGKNNLKNYTTEIENLISEKNGLFVNYGTQGWSSLNYLGQNRIEFKDKRYGK